jgi:hypothetical protein
MVIMTKQYSYEWVQEQLREKRRQARKAAPVFVDACKTADGELPMGM